MGPPRSVHHFPSSALQPARPSKSNDVSGNFFNSSTFNNCTFYVGSERSFVEHLRSLERPVDAHAASSKKMPAALRHKSTAASSTSPSGKSSVKYASDSGVEFVSDRGVKFAPDSGAPHRKSQRLQGIVKNRETCVDERRSATGNTNPSRNVEEPIKWTPIPANYPTSAQRKPTARRSPLKKLPKATSKHSKSAKRSALSSHVVPYEHTSFR